MTLLIADVPMYATFFAKLSTAKHASYESRTLKKSEPEMETGTLSDVKPESSLMSTYVTFIRDEWQY